MFHTSLKDVDLLREINRDFGLQPHDEDAQQQLGDHLQRFNEFLVAQYRAGKNCAIVLDDAQNLDRDSLELVRMISNLEAGQQKMVQILLVGQTELMTHLNSHAMRQLHSRIVIRKVVRSLSRGELRNYIRFKLSSAGDKGRITVTQPAFWRLYRRTKSEDRSKGQLPDENGADHTNRSAVHAFLSIYQLDRYVLDFQRSLREGKLDTLAQRIYGETGYQLVQLLSVPDTIRQRYGALAFSVPWNRINRRYGCCSGGRNWNCDGFTPTTGERLFSDLNLYNYKIDGIVGARLVRSVVAFQQQSNLPVTGFPDAVTLFWLCHQKGKEGQWPKA